MKPADIAERLILTLLACVMGTLIVEVGFRIFNPRPPTQVVRLLEQPQAFRPSLLHGEPVWKASADREHTACAEQFPDRPRILVFGDSITYGINLDATEVFTALLEEELNAGRVPSGVCVMNFAQPGFGFEQSFAVAQDAIARWKPALVLWEIFGDDRKYVIVDGTAYLVNPPYVGELKKLAVRPNGSIGFSAVPARWNALLFEYSRLYQTVALRWGEVESANVDRRERYRRLKALVDTAGAKLVLYFATSLERPFAALAVDPRWQPPEIVAFARENQVAAYVLPRELIAEDYLAIRLDSACHFNAGGHQALARRFQDIVLRELPGAAP